MLYFLGFSRSTALFLFVMAYSHLFQNFQKSPATIFPPSASNGYSRKKRKTLPCLRVPKKDGNNHEEHEDHTTLAGCIFLSAGIFHGGSRPACIRPDRKKQQKFPFQPFRQDKKFPALRKTVRGGGRGQDAGYGRTGSESI